MSDNETVLEALEKKINGKLEDAMHSFSQTFEQKTKTLEELINKINERDKPNIYKLGDSRYIWKPTEDKPLRFVECDENGCEK